MADIIHEQRALNRSTAGNRELFSEHRDRLMALVEAVPRGGRVALVGAGNCNDYDLPRLAERFASIDLIDVDEEAVAAAARVAGGTVTVRAPADVGGIGPVAEGLRAGASVSWAAEQLGPGQVPAGLGGYDLVVSAGVLTQAMRSVADVIGEDHAETRDLVLAVRSGHVRSLLEMVRPGGRVLLATEVVSNEVLPEIDSAADADLGGILFKAIVRGDVFLGVSPAALSSWLSSERPLGARLMRPGVVGPWRWRQSPSRTFLVIAFLLRRPSRS